MNLHGFAYGRRTIGPQVGGIGAAKSGLLTSLENIAMLNAGMSLMPWCCLFVGVAYPAQHRLAQGIAGQLHGVEETFVGEAAGKRQGRRSRKVV